MRQHLKAYAPTDAVSKTLLRMEREHKERMQRWEYKREKLVLQPNSTGNAERICDTCATCSSARASLRWPRCSG